MLVIGLTGGIGSGKSTVAELFAKLGVTIIDTDQLAKELTQVGSPVLKAIVDKFGNDILFVNGDLNRKALRAHIFDHPADRIWLEKQLHPAIRQMIQDSVKRVQSAYCIVVIPLLFETEPNPLINRVLLVDTTEELQIKRTKVRDQHSQHEVDAIMKAQTTRAKRIEAADDLIKNDGRIEDLTPQVEKLHRFYLSLSQ